MNRTKEFCRVGHTKLLDPLCHQYLIVSRGDVRPNCLTGRKAHKGAGSIGPQNFVELLDEFIEQDIPARRESEIRLSFMSITGLWTVI
jgi:hypothetical protein